MKRFVFAPTTKTQANSLSTEAGLFTYKITHPVDMKVSLLLYHSGFANWINIYKSPASVRGCGDMVQAADSQSYLWMDHHDFLVLGPQNFVPQELVGFSGYRNTLGSGNTTFSGDFQSAYQQYLNSLPQNRNLWFRGQKAVDSNSSSVGTVVNDNYFNMNTSFPGAFQNFAFSSGSNPPSVTYTGKRAFASSTPSWVFIAVANCDLVAAFNQARFCQGPLNNIHYYFELTNGASLTTQHLSYSDWGLLETNIVLFVGVTGLFVFLIWIRSVLYAKNKFHHTVKLLMLSTFLFWFSLLLGMAYYGSLGKYGTALPGLFEAERIVFGFADTGMVLLLVLLGKGWVMVRDKITASGRVKIAIFTSLYLMASIFAAVWRAEYFSEATSLCIYQTGPGIIVIVMRILAAVWFKYSVHTTRKNFMKKKNFYRVFESLYTLWLFYVPISAVISIGAPDYNKDKAVYIFERVCFFIGQFFTVLLFNPHGCFRRSFPFHSYNIRLKGDPQRAIEKDGKIQMINREGKPTALVNAAAVKASVSAPSEIKDKIIIMDSYEQLSIKRLKSVSNHIEDRLEKLQIASKQLQAALGKLHVPEGDTLDDGWNDAGGRQGARGRGRGQRGRGRGRGLTKQGGERGAGMGSTQQQPGSFTPINHFEQPESFSRDEDDQRRGRGRNENARRPSAEERVDNTERNDNGRGRGPPRPGAGGRGNFRPRQLEQPQAAPSRSRAQPRQLGDEFEDQPRGRPGTSFREDRGGDEFDRFGDQGPPSRDRRRDNDNFGEDRDGLRFSGGK